MSRTWEREYNSLEEKMLVIQDKTLQLDHKTRKITREAAEFFGAEGSKGNNALKKALAFSKTRDMNQ